MAGAVEKGHGQRTGAEAPFFMYLCDRQTRCVGRYAKTDNYLDNNMEMI
jgi:hypothetical protein